MKELLEFIVKSLVDDDNAVQVNVREDGKCTIYTISVNQSDIGKVIGKNGRVANAIRTVVKSVAKAKHQFAVVKINDK